MTRSMCSVLAACVAACGLAVPAMSADVVTRDHTVITADKSTLPTMPAGIETKDLKANKGLYNALGRIADDAMSKNGFDNLVGQLVKQDRERMGSAANMKVDDLNGLLDKIGQIYREKYNDKFKIDENKVYENFVTVVTGEVADPQQLVGKWPLTPSENLGTTVKNTVREGTDKGKVTPADADIAKNKYFGGDVKLEKGRNVALVHFPASHGMPALTASLISEATAWRFDIPNTIDAQQLHDNLVKHLTHLTDANLYPKDRTEADRMITHHVLGALYGVDMTGNTMAGEK